MAIDWVSRLPAFTTAGPGDDTPTPETIFEVLRNRRRRYALHYLKREAEFGGAEVDVSDLVEQVAAWEYDTTPPDLTTAQRQRVYVSFLQTHLPTMEDADVVRFDRDRRTVELTDSTAATDIYLEIVPADDIAWPEYYLSITAFNAGLLVLVWQDVYPFGTLPDAAWGLFVTSLFLLAALVHHLYHRRARLGTGPPPAN